MGQWFEQWNDRVKETSTTTGTGAITLAGAVTGYQTFANAFTNPTVVRYTIEGVDANGVPTGDWEVGVGTFTTTLSRDTIEKSSNANAVVNLSAGTKYVFCTIPQALVNTLDTHGQVLASAVGYALP